jgi:hypothetical protein
VQLVGVRFVGSRIVGPRIVTFNIVRLRLVSSGGAFLNCSGGVVNSTKTLKLIPIFLDFFRSLYAPVSNHVTPALILAELPL